MRRCRVVLLLWACLAVADPAAAQRVTTAVSGTVASDTGAGLEGVRVTVLNRETGLRRTGTTDADGRYLIVGLPVDEAYDIQAERPGFATVVREDVVLPADQPLAIDFSLSVAVAEVIVVRAGELSVDTERSTVQQTINERLVRSLPLFGRNFLDLASLAAGFAGNPDFPNPQGQLYWTNNVLVDGASHFSKWRGAARAFHSGYGLESIKEVQVLTNVFSAEFGEALATVTNVVTKAGTNHMRGSGLLFVQDDALNAVPAFTARKPASSAQQYGFTLGGPLVQDRTHFWGSYEGRRSRDHNVVVSPAALNAVVPNDQDEHLVFSRVDHQSSSGQLVTARFHGQWFRWHDETGGLALPGTGTSFQTDVHTVLVTDTLQLSSRLLNELRVQAARYVDIRQDLQPTVFVSRAGYSLEGGALGPFGFGANPEDTWEAADVLSWWTGPHAIRAGGGAKYVRAHNTFLADGRGAYYFAGSPDRSAQPFLFVQGLAETEDAAIADPRSLAAFGFIQDDWSVRSGLTLNLGLRYDVDDVSNVRGYAVSIDKNNIQPRFGAAWDPTGSGRMVVRGGVGLYTQQHLLYPINRVELEGPDGTRSISLAQDSPLLPIFPATLPAFLPGAALPPRDIHRVDATFTNPYSVQAAIGVERTVLGTQWAANYVYLTGHDLMSLVDANAPVSNLRPAQRTVAAADATRPIVPGPNGYRKIITLGNLGRSWYRALQVKAERAAGPLQVVASYTLSRAEDMANYQLPEDSRDIQADKARAVTDVRHNLVLGFTWETRGAGRLLGNWSLSGVGVFRSGRPYDITWGDDRNGTTQNDARPGDRNTGTTDAFENVDLALVKRFRHGTTVVDARVEAFNIFNTTNYDVYVGQLLSPLFAQPVSAFPQRRMQVAAIVRF